MTWYRAFLLKESETGSSLNALHRSPDHSSIRIRHVLMFSFGIIVSALFEPSKIIWSPPFSIIIIHDADDINVDYEWLVIIVIFSIILPPHLKEETDLASLPVEPGSIEVGASIWPFWFWWECWAWFVCEPAPWRLMPIKSAKEKRIDRAERLDPVEDLEAPWPARPSLPRRGLSTRQLLILPACSNSSCSRPISEQLKWEKVSSTEHQLACCLLSAHWGAADAAQSRCQHRPHKDLKPLPSNAPLLLPSPNIGNIRHIGCGCTYQYSVRANQPTLWVIFSTKKFYFFSNPAFLPPNHLSDPKGEPQVAGLAVKSNRSAFTQPALHNGWSCAVVHSPQLHGTESTGFASLYILGWEYHDDGVGWAMDGWRVEAKDLGVGGGGRGVEQVSAPLKMKIASAHQPTSYSLQSSFSSSLNWMFHGIAHS